MAQITQGVHLRYGGTGSTPSWARITHGSGASLKTLCVIATNKPNTIVTIQSESKPKSIALP